MQIIIDVQSVFARQYYGVPCDDREGQWAVTGSVNAMWRIIRHFGDGQLSRYPVAFAFDGETYHVSRVYPQYKAKRNAKPVTYLTQLQLLKRVLRSAGLTVVEMDGYEADDIAASYVAREQSYVVTGDHDMLQLVTVNESVVALLGRNLPVNGKFDDPLNGYIRLVSTDEDVGRIVGVPHDRLCMLKAIAGDASDNIPGARGVGKTFATRVIEHFDDSTILAGAVSVEGWMTRKNGGLSSVASKFFNSLDDIRFFYDIISMRYDLPVPTPTAVRDDMQDLARGMRATQPW